VNEHGAADLAFVLQVGQAFDEVASTADATHLFRVAERTGNHATLLHSTGAVVHVRLDPVGRIVGHDVVRVRRAPPPGALPGRGEMPVPVRTWGELLAVLRDDGATLNWYDALPDEVEVHALSPRGTLVYRFTIDDPASVTRQDLDLGPGRSRVFDAVRWRFLAERLAADAENTSDPAADLALAVGAWEQSLRFVEGDAVPDRRDAFVNFATHEFRQRFPRQFLRESLSAELELARRRMANFKS